MKPLTILVILTVLWDIAHSQCISDGSNINVGSATVKDNIKMLCTPNGLQPVACLPNGQLTDPEVLAGQFYTRNAFKWECVEEDAVTMTFKVVACLLPNGTEFSVGSSAIYPSKGKYSCIDNNNKTVSRLLQHGCYYNGQIFSPNAAWTQGQTMVTCVQQPTGLNVPTATGCILGTFTVPINGYIQNPTGSYSKCQQDPVATDQATLVPANADEYNAWQGGNIGRQIGVDRTGTGYIQPIEEGGGAKRMLLYPTPSPDLPSSGQCEDVHPMCQQLCSSPCLRPFLVSNAQFGGTFQPFPGPQPMQPNQRFRDFINRILGRSSGPMTTGYFGTGNPYWPGWFGFGWPAWGFGSFGWPGWNPWAGPYSDNDESGEFGGRPLQCLGQTSNLISLLCPRSCGGCNANTGTSYSTIVGQNWNRAYCAGTVGNGRNQRPNFAGFQDESEET